MDNIEKISSELVSGNITVKEVQRKLSVYLYSELGKEDFSVTAPKAELSITTLDNELELIIFTFKKEDQTEAALATLNKAQHLLLNGFIS